MNITLKRSGALGDVILTTTVLRRLRRENPEASIQVLTAYTDVFRNNPHTGGMYEAEDETRLIDLDLAYERRPDIHIVEAYMLEAFGDKGDPVDRTPELFPRKTVVFSKPTVAVHAAIAGWRNRTLPRSFWQDVVAALKRCGLNVLLVGTERDSLGPGVQSFLVPDLLAQAAMIKGCKAFVGSDSGLMHVATAVGTPMVGLFTCTDPALRLPLNAARCRALVADIPCVGCHHRQPAPATLESCPNPAVAPYACTHMFSPDDVVEIVRSLVA